MQAHARLHKTAAWWSEGDQEQGRRSSALQVCHPRRAPREITALVRACPPRKAPPRLPTVVCIASHSPPHHTRFCQDDSDTCGRADLRASPPSLPPFLSPNDVVLPSALHQFGLSPVPSVSQFSLFHWQQTNHFLSC